MMNKILLTISIVALSCVSTAYAMNNNNAGGNEQSAAPNNHHVPQKNFAQAEAFLNHWNENLLVQMRQTALDDSMPKEVRDKYPDEAAGLLDSVKEFKEFNAATEPNEQERLQCKLDQRIVALFIKVRNGQTVEEIADGLGAKHLTQAEKAKLYQIYTGAPLPLQKEVDDRAAKLGLPRLFNQGIWSKTKTFAWDGNRKFVTLSIAALVGVAWYMRHKADELDLKGRVKACKDYVQTKLGLKKNLKHA